MRGRGFKRMTMPLAAVTIVAEDSVPIQYHGVIYQALSRVMVQMYEAPLRDAEPHRQRGRCSEKGLDGSDKRELTDENSDLLLNFFRAHCSSSWRSSRSD